MAQSWPVKVTKADSQPEKAWVRERGKHLHKANSRALEDAAYFSEPVGGTKYIS